MRIVSTRSRCLLRASLLIVVLLPALAVAQRITEELQTQLNSKPAARLQLAGHGFSAEKIDSILAALYQERNFAPFWVNTRGPGEKAKVILAAITAAPDEGLLENGYQRERIESRWDARDPVVLAQLDILLTIGLGSYIADASEGRVDPKTVDPKLFAGARDVQPDLLAAVKEALATNDLESFLHMQLPQHGPYQRLRKALPGYKALAAEGGWKLIPEGPTLKPGMTDPRLSLVEKRLHSEGYLKRLTAKNTFSPSLEEAVIAFQKSRGLEPDGVIGSQTLHMLNISAAELVKIIKINLERWRWVVRDLGDHRVFVNIPDYLAGAARGEHAEFLMPVVVGKAYHMTPVFSHRIRYIEFNPYWNIPTGIAVNEMLPKLKKDPHHLRNKQIRVFDSWNEDARELDSTTMNWHQIGGGIRQFRLRQDPGPYNALGRVKFMFPNSYNVYMHDTPSRSLFSKTKRAFSHGCIRVGKPLEFAEYLLGGSAKGWSAERIQGIIDSGERKVVNLKQPVPVHILYRTAWVTPDGTMNFREDLYGRDRILIKALFG